MSKSQGRPLPHHMAVRESPNSRKLAGRTVVRRPKYRALGMSRPSSRKPQRATRSQWPIQRSHFDSKGAVELRSIVKAGIGRALFDRIMLLCQPGPHQRSVMAAATIQLPRAMPA